MNTRLRRPRFADIRNHRAFLPTAVFLLLVLILVTSFRLSDRPPWLESISPEVGYPGMVLLVKGSHFGIQRNGAEVVIAGIRPPTSAYLEWTDSRISVRVPEDVDSGFVFVNRGGSRSNGKLFTNSSNIPTLLSGNGQPGQPFLESISPSSGTVGTLISLKGSGFGAARGGGRVYFSPIPVSDASDGTGGPEAGDSGSSKERLGACECDYSYVNWSDTEIDLYVPDGAAPGNVVVENALGASNAQYFEVVSPVGTEEFTDRRGYQIHYGMQLTNVDADPDAPITVWMPSLAVDPSQRNVESVQDPKPLHVEASGLMRYQFSGLNSATTYGISVTDYFDRYAVVTRIDPTRVPTDYDADRELYKRYSSPDALIPSADPAVAAVAREAVGSETNPYLKAQEVYQALIGRLKYGDVPAGAAVTDSLQAGTADAYAFAMLYVACLRSVGIPARPVAGYLVFGDRHVVRHFWAEFNVPEFGWIPVDPALGSGGLAGAVSGIQDPRTYYFGDLDSQHIAFSRGLVDVQPVDPHDKSVQEERMFSLQAAHEEIASGVRSYSAFWQDAAIVDWW